MVVAVVAASETGVAAKNKKESRLVGLFTFTIMPKKILFVCVENSNRSQMSQAFAKIMGGDEVKAYSAGSRLSGGSIKKLLLP